MNRKLKLAVAALLGFSAACSSVKNAPREQGERQSTADTTGAKPEIPRRVVVMYGVPMPRTDSIRRARAADRARQRPDSLPPVAEQPRDEDPSSGSAK